MLLTRRSAGRLEPPGSRGKALGKVPLEAIVQAGHGVAPVRRGVVGPVPHANGELGAQACGDSLRAALGLQFMDVKVNSLQGPKHLRGHR